ncbi:putative chromatin regulator PHD family [Helianthus annuus]|nr:putative chromatin regulator PHD family [Helianthus annuus]
MESQSSGNSDRIQLLGDGLAAEGGAVAVVEAVKVEVGGGEREAVKRKRGRPPKAQAKPVVVKRQVSVASSGKKVKEVVEDEDVCFICFDGGSLVLCDHRACPKAYHPACIKRDEEFFESAAKWNCGWHICSICQKTAHHMCYTCTYSLCRGCVRKADYVSVRGDKGFCTICMKTIMLIENNGQGEDGKVQADFDDKLSWEYLFKVYWLYIKGKLSLTLDELVQARAARTEASTISSALPSTSVHNRADDLSVMSATSVGNLEEENESKRRKKDEQINLQNEIVNIEKPAIDESATTEWATKELLDFVAHMKGESTAVLSRIDVEALLMEYINRNNLYDPKKKNQIICDSRLKSLFGKPRVGRSQMLKLLEHHFVVKEDSKKRRVKSTTIQVNQVYPDWNSDKKRKSRSKGEGHVLQNSLDEFAAVDVHNISLIYLRRDLMVNLLEDSDSFHGKVVGSVVRIKISGCDLKHDMYRLVQVVGTSKADIPCKIDSKSVDIMLEVLNLDKKETISIDAISDQEFSEEECRSLQRSIRCGLVKHFTVGEIQEKATALRLVKLNDWIAKEILRLEHLRDLASQKRQKKNYRECEERIQFLKTPEEKERRLKEIPDVHFDPKMNPDYESDDTEEYFNKEHGDHMESKYSGKKSRPSKKRQNRSRKDEKPNNGTITTLPAVEPSTICMETDAPASTLEKSQHEVDRSGDCNGSTITKLDQQATLSSSVSNHAPETAASVKTTSFSNDTVWHYRDPNGKVQGPFSLVQLQRWSTTGYFPAEMKIWADNEDKSLLLTDVLEQQFHNRETTTAANKVADETEGANVGDGNPSSTVAVTPYVPDLVNHEKLSESQSFGQNWSGNNSNNNNNNLNYNPPSVESTVQVDTSNMPTPDIEKCEDVKHVPTAAIDLPGPTPKKTLSFGSDSGGGGGGSGGNLKPPAKGQRVCRFYESGRCKKGASCNYLHPSP